MGSPQCHESTYRGYNGPPLIREQKCIQHLSGSFFLFVSPEKEPKNTPCRFSTSSNRTAASHHRCVTARTRPEKLELQAEGGGVSEEEEEGSW